MAGSKIRNIASLRVMPIKSGVKDFNELVQFYLYTAPLIDSVLSSGDMNEEDQSRKTEQILRTLNLKKDVFLKQIRTVSFEKRNLSGDEIDFTKQAMLCRVMNNETDLRALLRHIRNAIAHGYVSIFQKKYVCFDDYDSAKNGGKHSARIVVSIDTLRAWKEIILS